MLNSTIRTSVTNHLITGQVRDLFLLLREMLCIDEMKNGPINHLESVTIVL